MWIGTRKGLSEFDGKSWSNYTQENGLADNVVNTIHEDQNGNIWVGTEDLLVARRGGGVSMFDGKNWTIYTKNDKLIGKTIYRIEEDSQGNLWFITSSRGISKYTPETNLLQSDL
jgi:ligand-binding sensor domain-containing protein